MYIHTYIDIRNLHVHMGGWLYVFVGHCLVFYYRQVASDGVGVGNQSCIGIVSRYKRIFSSGSRMGILLFQSSMWAMRFYDVAIMPLARAE